MDDVLMCGKARGKSFDLGLETQAQVQSLTRAV